MTCRHCGGKTPPPGRVCGSPACIQRRKQKTAARKVEKEAAPKKPINSRRKGKRGELEFAKALAALGHPASRGQQRKGGEDSPDVICESLPWVHWEVKLMNTCRIFSPAQVAEWEAQATRDCGTKHPVIAHRWNGARQWWVRVWTSGHGPYWQALPDFIQECGRLRRAP